MVIIRDTILWVYFKFGRKVFRQSFHRKIILNSQNTIKTMGYWGKKYWSHFKMGRNIF